MALRTTRSAAKKSSEKDRISLTINDEPYKLEISKVFASTVQQC